MTKLCSTPKCLLPARKGQRYCARCHAGKAKLYRAKAKKELDVLRANQRGTNPT